jgi:hypothetical protein
MLNYILSAVVGISMIGYALFFPHPMNQVIGIYNGVNNAPGSIGTNTYHPVFNPNMRNNPNGSSIIGNVTGVSSATLTVETIQRTSPATASTTSVIFTVDASGARFIKQGATTTTSISDIKIGDRIIAQGTINGTSVIAKTIIDTLQSNIVNQTTRTSTSISTSKRTSVKTTPKKK